MEQSHRALSSSLKSCYTSRSLRPRLTNASLTKERNDIRMSRSEPVERDRFADKRQTQLFELNVWTATLGA